jgi:deoxynucleoside kinase
VFHKIAYPRLRVAIEGNISAGKSTILQKLAAFSDITVYPEPVDEWQGKSDGHNHLNLMYKDPNRFAASLQTKVMITNYQRMHLACPTKIAVYERSPASANLFRRYLGTMGHIPASTAAVLDDLETILPVPPIDHYFYIQMDPVTCIKRITLRHRHGEENINLDYLTSIERLHHQWIAND